MSSVFDSGYESVMIQNCTDAVETANGICMLLGDHNTKYYFLCLQELKYFFKTLNYKSAWIIPAVYKSVLNLYIYELSGNY